MKLKLKLFLYFSLFSLTCHSQNFLKSLYDIDENFPADMKKAREFITLTTSDYLIYNFISGGNSGYQANYQFAIRDKKNLQIDLPFTDEFSVHFIDYKTKLPVREHTFYVDYQFEYLRYYNEFIVNSSLFSPLSYYNLALEINNNDYFELTREIIGQLMTDEPYDLRYTTFLNQIAKHHKFNKKQSIDAIFENEEDDLSEYEKVEKLINYLADEMDEELPLVIYNSFIHVKSDDKKTKENLQKIYGQTIINRVEDALQQTITINTNKSAFLKTPEKYFTFQSDNNHFPLTVIEVKLDFKNKLMLVNFKSGQSIKTELKNGIDLQDKKTLQSVSLNVNQIQFIIAEKEIKMNVEDVNTKRRFEINMKN
jgi:hypothetical protein